MGSQVVRWRIWKQFRSFRFVALYDSLLFSSSCVWISARFKWRWHTFLPTADGHGVYPFARSTRKSPLNCTHLLWDLWVRKIAWLGWSLHSLLRFASLCLYWLCQPIRSAPNEGVNVTVICDQRHHESQRIQVPTTALRSALDFFLILHVQTHSLSCSTIPLYHMSAGKGRCMHPHTASFASSSCRNCASCPFIVVTTSSGSLCRVVTLSFINRALWLQSLS